MWAGQAPKHITGRDESKLKVCTLVSLCSLEPAKSHNFETKSPLVPFDTKMACTKNGSPALRRVEQRFTSDGFSILRKISPSQSRKIRLFRVLKMEKFRPKNSDYRHNLIRDQNLGGGRLLFTSGQISDPLVPKYSKNFQILGPKFKIFSKNRCFIPTFCFYFFILLHFLSLGEEGGLEPHFKV